MANLEEILSMPAHWRMRTHVWNRLTQGDTLFQALHKSIHSGPLGKAQQWIDDWEPFVKTCDENIQHQWDTARKLVWCAEQAATQPDFYRTKIDPECFALKEIPEFIKEDKVWAWICIRTFLGTPGRQVKVPVAAWKDQQGEGKGFLATLQLELIEKGSGQIAHHPAEVFCTHIDKEFHSAIEDAWIAAKNLVRQEGKEVMYDGRWRLLQDGQSLSKATGRSAGGAAALGWYHVLMGTIPDEGTIVLAQVDHEGGLHGVDGIRAKVRAISQDRRIDTIIVVNDENQYQAKESLKRFTNKRCIHIVPCIPPRIDKLVTIRSLLVNDLIYYLKTMEEELTKNPLLERFGRKLDEIRLPLHVVPYEPAQDIEEIRVREHLQKIYNLEGEDNNFHQIYAHGLDQGKDSLYQRDQLYETDKKSAHRIEQLDELESRLQIGVLLGDPGSGKTEWLKHHAYLAARDARKQLEGFEVELQDLCLPAYLRFRDISVAFQKEKKLLGFLVETGCARSQSYFINDANRLASAILLTLITHHKMPKRLAPWVWNRIHLQHETDRGDPILLCLDAWDEIQSRKEDLARCFMALAQQMQARIFLTSRPIGYTHSLLPVYNKNEVSHRELKICAFTWDETESFVGQFFHNDQERGQKMLGGLREKISIVGMAQNPLLVTLLCMAYSPNPYCTPLSFPVRRGEVYQHVLERLLGEWKTGDKGIPDDTELISAKIQLLEEIASHFFPNKAIKRECLYDFLRNAKTGYMKKLDDTDPLRQILGRNPKGRVIKELCKDGILVPCGGVNMQEYTFLHLTFQEYLVATFYARQANQEGWQEIMHLIDKKVWDPLWQEVIIMIAGKLEHPVPLLKLLSNKKKDDFFRHRLGVAALCLPEIPTNKLNLQTDIFVYITTECFYLWIKYWNDGNQEAIAHISRGLSALGQTNAYININIAKALYKITVRNKDIFSDKPNGLPLLDCLYKMLQDDDKKLQEAGAEAIRAIGISAARPDILNLLVGLLRDENSEIQQAAGLTLREIGTSAVRSDIFNRLEGLLGDKNKDICSWAIWILGSMRSVAMRPEIIDRLMKLLKDKNWNIQRLAVSLLLELRSTVLYSDLFDCLANLLRDKSAYVRLATVRTLQDLGRAAAWPKILNLLIELLRDENSGVRIAAASALGAMGSAVGRPEILNRLVELLRDENRFVRQATAIAVGYIGSFAARSDILDLLLMLLKDIDNVRSAAAWALVVLDSPARRLEISDRLRELLRDENRLIRVVASWLLWNIINPAGRPAILDHLVKLLRDEDKDVREIAALVIREIGNAAARPDILNCLMELLMDENGHVQMRAVQAIGSIGSAETQPEIFDRLMKLLWEEECAKGIRQAVAWAFKKFSVEGVRIFKVSRKKFEARNIRELSQRN